MVYPGGKNAPGIWQRIINLMPPHEIYIEPFLGSGAVMRLKRPARVNIGIDLDTDALAAVSAEVARGSGIIPTARLSGPIPRNGDVRSLWNLYRTDAICYLTDLASSEPARQASTLIYCDPPYLMTTRSSTRNIYSHELGDVGRHRCLLRCLRKLRSMVIVSGYWSELYARELKTWNHVSYQAMTRGGTARTEFLWFNFPAPRELHDYRYLGENFRERERIKRKKLRWTARLERMPALERLALYAAIEGARGL
jgi:DNA adenine methylase